MSIRLFGRAGAPVPQLDSLCFPQAEPDAGFEAVARLTHLRDRLVDAVAISRSRWKQPAVFFFDRSRQADYTADQSPPATADCGVEVARLIAAELPRLYESVEVRHAARAIAGFAAAAEALASTTPAANDLAELLAIPDDEVVLVLHPELRAGFRLAIRGIADVGQLHILMAESLLGILPGPPLPFRFVAACRDANPTTPAGVPMIATARWQMYTPAALRPDCTLPVGMGACEHWLWPSAPMRTVPRIGGERVVLLGPPAFAATWEVARRFPALPATLELIESLSPLRVIERLTRQTGEPVASRIQDRPVESLLKAA